MKTPEELKEEYDYWMEFYRAALEMKDYEEAEYFFNKAQKVEEGSDTE